MSPRIPSAITLAALMLLVQACGQAPVHEQAAPAVPAAAPEISLNLPAERTCECTEAPDRDFTFLEKGYTSLGAGDYVDAVQYFQRYQRLEAAAEAQWEAAVGIAYVSSLSNSPFYDAAEARKAFNTLNQLHWRQMSLHPQSLLLRQSLQNFVVLERHVDELETANRTLEEDLAKREEAIKRLRELTLGQKAGSP